MTYRIVVICGASAVSWDTHREEIGTVVGWAAHMVRWTPCEAYVYDMQQENTPSVACAYTQENDRSVVRVNLDNLTSLLWDHASVPHPEPGDVFPAK